MMTEAIICYERVMNEHPVRPLPFVEEYPVPEPNLFLLRRMNYGFVERRNDNAYIGIPSAPIVKPSESQLIGVLLLLAMVGIFLFTTLPTVVGLYCWIALLLLASLYGFTLVLPPSQGPLQELAGWIIRGEVVHSEKIRVEGQRFVREQLGIRYHFTTPQGEVIEDYAEGDSSLASDKMAPAPGTPVRVWYDDNGNNYLL